MALQLTLLHFVLLLAGVGALVLVAISALAFLRRGTRSYLLILLALTTVLARPVLAGLSLTGSVPGDIHHFLEHSLDVVMAALVIAAVYYARRVEKTAGGLEGRDPHG